MEKGLPVAISNFEKYVDAHYDPLIDENGDQLFEVQVVNNAALNLSSDAKTILRSLFRQTIELTKKQNAKRL